MTVLHCVALHLFKYFDRNSKITCSQPKFVAICRVCCIALPCIALHGNPGPVSPSAIMQHSHSPLLPCQKPTGLHNFFFFHTWLFALFARNQTFKIQEIQLVACGRTLYILVTISCWCHSGGHLTCSVSYRPRVTQGDQKLGFLFALVQSLVYFRNSFWEASDGSFISVNQSLSMSGPPFPFVVF